MLKVNDELKELIPKLQEDEYKLLEESILEEGCRDSLIIWDNTIIDGHNRYEICKKHNIEFTTSEMDFDNIEDVKEWMVLNQLGRRNILDFVKRELLEELKKVELKKGLHIISETNKTRNKSTLSTIDKPEKPHNTRKILADKLNWSTGKLAMADVVIKKAPEEVKEKLRVGEISINQAYQEIKKEEKKEKLHQKKEEYQERVEQAIVEDKPNKVDIEKTDKKFRIIYADPCWSYNDKQNTDKLGGAIKHYDTMSIKELSELPVKDIIEDDAVLFLWVTSPLLEASFEVIKAWGFKYKTSFVWDKVKHNMGHYNSVRHEFLLIATKGSCTPDNKKLYDSVQSIERTEHSAKPKEFMDIIDDIYIYGDRLEMFAREQHKDNWLYWGNEI